jgi:hypothetical protein
VKRTLVAIAALAVLPVPLRAQDAPRAALDVVAVGPGAALAAMADRVRSLEARFPVAVRWTAVESIDVRAIVAPRAVDEGVFARVWLDLSNPERAVLFLANAGHDRFLVRVLPVSDDYGELTRESLATVVESAIDALLAGGQIGVDRGTAVREIEAQTGTPIAAKPPAPAAPIASEAAPGAIAPRREETALQPALLITAQYRVDAVAAGPALRHGPQLGIAGSFGWGAAIDLLLGVSAQYVAPFSIDDAGRGVEQYGGGARIAVGATGRAGGNFNWQAALGGGIDRFRVEPAVAASTGLEAAEPFSITAPVATLFANFAWRPAAWIEFGLGAGLDVALSGPHFDVQSGSARAQAISPWRVHPYGLVGIGTPIAVGESR